MSIVVIAATIPSHASTFRESKKYDKPRSEVSASNRRWVTVWRSEGLVLRSSLEARVGLVRVISIRVATVARREVVIPIAAAGVEDINQILIKWKTLLCWRR